MTRPWLAFMSADPAFRLLLGLHLLALVALVTGLRRGDRWTRVGRGLFAAGTCMNLLLLARLGWAADQFLLTTSFQVLLGYALLTGIAAWIEGFRSGRLMLAASVLMTGLLLLALGRLDLEVPDLPPGLHGILPSAAMVAKLAAWSSLTVAGLLGLLGLLDRESSCGDQALPWLRGGMACLAVRLLLVTGMAPDVGAPEASWNLAALLGCAAALHLRRVPAWRGRPFLLLLLVLLGLVLWPALGTLPSTP